MTSCKEINAGKVKRITFNVKITFEDHNREMIADDLRKINNDWKFANDLANIIEKG